jgi:hypothetical protein
VLEVFPKRDVPDDGWAVLVFVFPKSPPEAGCVALVEVFPKSEVPVDGWAVFVVPPKRLPPVDVDAAGWPKRPVPPVLGAPALLVFPNKPPPVPDAFGFVLALPNNDPPIAGGAVC